MYLPLWNKINKLGISFKFELLVEMKDLSMNKLVPKNGVPFKCTVLIALYYLRTSFSSIKEGTKESSPKKIFFFSIQHTTYVLKYRHYSWVVMHVVIDLYEHSSLYYLFSFKSLRFLHCMTALGSFNGLINCAILNISFCRHAIGYWQ